MIFALQCKINGEPVLVLFRGDEWTRESMIQYVQGKDLGCSDFGNAIALKDNEGCLGVVFSLSE